MTTTTSTNPSLTNAPSAPRQFAGVLIALGGRLGWRYWTPTVAWLVFGLLTAAYLRVVQPRDESGLIRIVTTPSGFNLLATGVAIALIWLWGVRFALSLGFRRTMVVVGGWIVSLALMAWAWISVSIANHLELALVGRYGVRAFAIENTDKFGTDDRIWNSSGALLAVLFVPLAAGAILTFCGWLAGRGVGAALGAAAAFFGLVMGALVVIPAVEWLGGADQSNLGAVMIGVALQLALCIAGSVYAIRHASV